MKVRLANLEDLAAIMHIENLRYAVQGEGVAAQEQTMRERILLLNQTAPGWFWVAEDATGQVVGYMIAQPTNIQPEKITGWNDHTNNGDLNGSYNPNGENVSIVSLAVLEDAPEGTADFLVMESFITWSETGKKRYIFTSEMPGFLEANQTTGISAEEYWQLKDSKGAPVDWMLKLYYDMGGHQPERLLKNGYPPDIASGGHAVLFVFTDFGKMFRAMAKRFYRQGRKQGQKEAVR